MKKAVFVQCRLGSTRLPQKALLKLDNMYLIEHVMNSLHKINADDYYILTDKNSFSLLQPIVEKHQWKIFVGDELDVLNRFCSLLTKIKLETPEKFPEYIIRGTADNPFLFYEAVEHQVKSYETLIQNQKCDYYTYSGLPHGSGVEIINSNSLLQAEKETTSLYDHEHVGPALYNHQDKYNCVFQESPSEWNKPDLRTTVDTIQDFSHVNCIIRQIKKDLNKSTLEYPLSSISIINACNRIPVKNPILVIPELSLKHGTGHFVRCLELASKNNFDLYYPQNQQNEVFKLILNEKILSKELFEDQIITNTIIEKYYAFVLCDCFRLNKQKAKKYLQIAPLISIDEGNMKQINNFISYSLNFIPSLISEKYLNQKNYSMIKIPHNDFQKKRLLSVNRIKKILIVLGGIDNSSIGKKIVNKLLKSFGNDISITLIHNKKFTFPSDIKIIQEKRIENLRDKYVDYDLVITKYGFSAFEAISSMTPVITIATSNLHKKLSKKFGFICINKHFSKKSLMKAIEQSLTLQNSSFIQELQENYLKKNNFDKESNDYIQEIISNKTYYCPLCQSDVQTQTDKVVYRDEYKTIKKCKKCKNDYIHFVNSKKQTYNSDYFFSDYKKQYGKTYLEDFDNIKKQGIRRHSIVNKIYLRNKQINIIDKPLVLDIGCAFGPYLTAANELNWMVYGLDVSQQGIEYISNELHFQAICEQFPSKEITKKFGVDKFNAITMWYVIEHFENLKEVIKQVKSLLSYNGVFAFSTPTSSGVSGRFNKKKFYQNSPMDHFSIMNTRHIVKYLEFNGFKVQKIVSTGTHTERFPFIVKNKIPQNSLIYKFFSLIMKKFSLGDTVEIYCVLKDKNE